MATVHATLNQPPDDANTLIRRKAAGLGYALAEGRSGADVLVFKKGLTLFSWGSQLTVKLEADSPSGTHLTVTTDETLGITDWGRGRRKAGRLLDAVGARMY